MIYVFTKDQIVIALLFFFIPFSPSSTIVKLGENENFINPNISGFMKLKQL